MKFLKIKGVLLQSERKSLNKFSGCILISYFLFLMACSVLCEVQSKIIDLDSAHEKPM